jgi:hypothetical protein
MNTKLVYAVMIEKKNGSILAPIIFECSEEAKAEKQRWQESEPTLSVWILACHLHKKQRVPV